MKVLIAILTLIATRSLWEANAWTFIDVERYWTAMVTNDVMYTPNRSEWVQDLQYKKTIDDNNPLLINATVTRVNGDQVVFETKDLSICGIYNEHDWEYVVYRIYTRAMMPGGYHSKCPWKPQTCEIKRYQARFIWESMRPLVPGKYEISYTATWQKKPVFSTLKFSTTLLPPYSSYK